jgi:hypothetical protein
MARVPNDEYGKFDRGSQFGNRSSLHENQPHHDKTRAIRSSDPNHVSKSKSGSALDNGKPALKSIEPIRIINIFRQLDTDRSGDISVSEFKNGLTKNRKLAVLLGLIDSQKDDLSRACDALFKKVDQDSSGQVDIVELLRFYGHRCVLLYPVSLQHFINTIHPRLIRHRIKHTATRRKSDTQGSERHTPQASGRKGALRPAHDVWV